MTSDAAATSTRDIRLPALSATMESATLIEWRIRAGDTVAQGQPIAEVETDKVDMEVEAPFAGTVVSLGFQPGDQLAIGEVMATAITADEDLLGFLDQADAAPASTVSTAALAAKSSAIIKAAPAARRLARENGLDLSGVRPTGTRRQVTIDDVHAHLDRPAPEQRTAATRRATEAVVNRSAAIPQFTLYRQLDLTWANAEKRAESWTTIFVRALASALRLHPDFNGQWSDEDGAPRPLDAVRVTIAVDRPGIGLTTAAVADPDQGDIASVDRLVRQVIDRARSSKARPDDLAPAGLTVSNLGGFGVDRFNAMITPPQLAVLSVGAIGMRAVATGSAGLRAALTCEVGLTIDHRAADGADGARFLDTFADLVERGR